jgi:hypothetical protein
MATDRYLQFVDRKPLLGRALLWPVRVWKVLYPSQRVSKLNLFEQAILGFSRARCQDFHEMAELLGLDLQLVLFIFKQLESNGWMTDAGYLTPKGERILEETEDANEEVRIGYAYQDAISGDWLPRFTEELPELEPSRIDDRGFPVFCRNKDSGKEDRPFRLGHLVESSLDITALFEAFQRYRIDYEFAKQLSGVDELPMRLRIESLSFVDDTAQPMWLWTWAFPDKTGAHPWLIADPFGIQQAVSWLRKPMKEILPKNEHLARYISNLLGEEKPSEMSANEWLSFLESRIDLELLADYPWSRKVPSIEGYLTSVLRIKQLLVSQDQFQQEYATSLLIETHNLVESVLQWLLKAFPVDAKRLPDKSQDKKWTKEFALIALETIATDFPLLTKNSIRRLSTQNLREIRNALIRGNSSLKALIFAALIATVEHIEHPLRKISADGIAIDRILDMADTRNKKAGHSGTAKVNKDEALEYAEFVIQWIQIFKEWY